jgi:hypothetical protein
MPNTFDTEIDKITGREFIVSDEKMAECDSE